MRFFMFVFSISGVLCWVAVAGCAKSQPEAPAGESSAATEHEHHHGDEGPHGGHIIELGAEDYHAELTHDEEDHRVGIHILDSSAKKAVPIAAESVTINVTVDGKLTPYVLAASPQTSETDGKSSYFEVVSEPLCEVVCGEAESPNTNARVSIQIEGKPYVGMIETGAHEHDHDHGHGHGHDH